MGGPSISWLREEPVSPEVQQQDGRWPIKHGKTPSPDPGLKGCFPMFLWGQRPSAVETSGDRSLASQEIAGPPIEVYTINKILPTLRRFAKMLCGRIKG